MIITGDPRRSTAKQPDLGLAEAVSALTRRGYPQVKFTAEDVIRHELVARIVTAYEGLPQKPAAGKS